MAYQEAVTPLFFLLIASAKAQHFPFIYSEHISFLVFLLRFITVDLIFAFVPARFRLCAQGSASDPTNEALPLHTLTSAL